jgi:predicted nucleic acid-binding Zn ribbon protein
MVQSAMTRDSDSSKPSKVSDILSAILTDRGWNTVVREHRVFAVWRESVGGTIADNARPVKINRGLLVVVVSSPIWTQELSLMKETIIGRLNDRLGDTVVRDIRFVQGDVTGG